MRAGHGVWGGTAAAAMLIIVAGAGGGAAEAGQPGRPNAASALAVVSAHSGQAAIYLVGVSDGPLRRISRGLGMSTSPAWNPDGRRLAFIHQAAGGTGRLTILDTASGRRIVGDLGERAAAPRWSPDGRRIAFLATARGGPANVYLADAEGRRAAPITGAGVLVRPGAEPAWSPDGRRIAVVSRVGRAEQEIAIIDLVTGARARLAAGYAPTWSPDGRWVAFVAARVGDARIYVTESSGRGPARPVAVAGINLLPAWSPDGRWIAFVSDRTGEFALFVLRPGGTGTRRLAPVYTDLTSLPLAAWRP
jgi:TolB protein